MRITCEFVLRGWVVVGCGVGLCPTKCVLRDFETNTYMYLFFRVKTGAAMAAPDAPKATALIPDVHEIARSLVPDNSQAMPIFHAYTRCGTVSSFHTRL